MLRHPDVRVEHTSADLGAGQARHPGHSERTVASMGNVQEGRVLGCNNGR